MDIIVGLLIWGGLLALVSRWVMRVYRRPSPRTAVAPAQPATPAARPSIAPAAVEESAREAGALVDGLIIGHHLTRGHYQDRLDEQAETIDGLRAEVAADTYFGDDDLDDLGDVDDLGGYGTVGFVDGFEGAEAHEFEGLGAGGDPWDDDVFGDDEDD